MNETVSCHYVKRSVRVGSLSMFVFLVECVNPRLTTSDRTSVHVHKRPYRPPEGRILVPDPTNV